MDDTSVQRALIDTSVLIELGQIDAGVLPGELAISSVSLAELAAGPHATSDPIERAARQDRLQRIEATFDPLPFDVSAARAFGRVYAAVSASGRKPRGRRAFDLLIGATAISAGIPVVTMNPKDFAGLDDLLEVVPMTRPG